MKKKIRTKDNTFISCLEWNQGLNTTRSDYAALVFPKFVKILGVANANSGANQTVRFYFRNLNTLSLSLSNSGTVTLATLQGDMFASAQIGGILLAQNTGTTVQGSMMFFPHPIVTNEIQAVGQTASIIYRLNIFYKLV